MNLAGMAKVQVPGWLRPGTSRRPVATAAPVRTSAHRLVGRHPPEPSRPVSHGVPSTGPSAGCGHCREPAARVDQLANALTSCSARRPTASPTRRRQPPIGQPAPPWRPREREKEVELAGQQLDQSKQAAQHPDWLGLLTFALVRLVELAGDPRLTAIAYQPGGGLGKALGVRYLLRSRAAPTRGWCSRSRSPTAALRGSRSARPAARPWTLTPDPCMSTSPGYGRLAHSVRRGDPGSCRSRRSSSVIAWRGRETRPGRGEAESGLFFDRVDRRAGP